MHQRHVFQRHFCTAQKVQRFFFCFNSSILHRSCFYFYRSSLNTSRCVWEGKKKLRLLKACWILPSASAICQYPARRPSLNGIILAVGAALMWQHTCLIKARDTLGQFCAAWGLQLSSAGRGRRRQRRVQESAWVFFFLLTVFFLCERKSMKHCQITDG